MSAYSIYHYLLQHISSRLLKMHRNYFMIYVGMVNYIKSNIKNCILKYCNNISAILECLLIKSVIFHSAPPDFISHNRIVKGYLMFIMVLRKLKLCHRCWLNYLKPLLLFKESFNNKITIVSQVR